MGTAQVNEVVAAQERRRGSRPVNCPVIKPHTPNPGHALSPPSAAPGGQPRTLPLPLRMLAAGSRQQAAGSGSRSKVPKADGRGA